MNYIKEQLSTLGWTEEFKNILKSNHIHFKEDSTSDLVILFNNYNDLFQSKINQVLRSVVISKNNKNIVSYSCATPLENNEGVNYLLRNSLEENKPVITECYEGTFMSLFNYEGKWYLSTRKCLDANESKFKEKSYFEMFENVLKLGGFESFEKFTETLNTSLNYYFILLDSENINIVDYSFIFGEDYHKLVFVYCRDSEQNIVDDTIELNEYIIKPKVFDDVSYLDEYNDKHQWELPAKSEGLVLRYNDETLIKLQSLDYQFAKAVGTDNNIYLGMMKMYQLDKLDDYINYKDNKEKFEKITNPLNTSESYLTLGMINSVFRTLTTEIYECYSNLYNDNALPVDADFYQILPSEYRYFMFKIRGIHYKKINNNKVLSEKDVYYLLKKTDIEKIYSLMRMRKLMLNLSFQNKFDENMKKFRMLSKNVNKINLKLVNIYTSKLFPEIMDKDVPENISSQMT